MIMGAISRNDRYKQHYEHFGRMNNLLYQMPAMFAIILGGLWFFAASYISKDPIIASAIFAFALAAGICFIISLQRFRMAFNAYIDNVNKMDGDMRVTLRSSRLPSVISAMQGLLWASLLISTLGFFYPLIKPTLSQDSTRVAFVSSSEDNGAVQISSCKAAKFTGGNHNESGVVLLMCDVPK